MFVDLVEVNICQHMVSRRNWSDVYVELGDGRNAVGGENLFEISRRIRFIFNLESKQFYWSR